MTKISDTMWLLSCLKWFSRLDNHNCPDVAIKAREMLNEFFDRKEYTE